MHHQKVLAPMDHGVTVISLVFQELKHALDRARERCESDSASKLNKILILARIFSLDGERGFRKILL
jgi:hypothetical protein